MGTTNRGPCGCCDPPGSCIGGSSQCNLINSVSIQLPALSFETATERVKIAGQFSSDPDRCCKFNELGSDGGFGSSLAGTYVVPFNRDFCDATDYWTSNGSRKCDGAIGWGYNDSPAKGEIQGTLECIWSTPPGAIGTRREIHAQNTNSTTYLWLAELSATIECPQYPPGSGVAAIDIVLSFTVASSSQTGQSWDAEIESAPPVPPADLVCEFTGQPSQARTTFEVVYGYTTPFGQENDSEGEISNCLHRINALLAKAVKIADDPSPGEGAQIVYKYCPFGTLRPASDGLTSLGIGGWGRSPNPFYADIGQAAGQIQLVSVQ